MATLEEFVEKMDKSTASLKESLGTLRAGKVTAQLLDKVTVVAYGEKCLLKSVAQISALSATDLSVKTFDPSIIKDLVSGLNKADLGCTVTQNGNAIILKFPAPSEDRRQDLIKQAKKYTEDGKVAIRNIRRDANNAVKKDTALSEDMKDDLTDKIQKETDKHIAEIEKILALKIKDIETI
ncbi:MAG: ribosome recycling factor [Candidatus Enterosoma sp.]|nr:ribosome recycling factor [Bacilli bacterium]MDD7180815.1 ribosome recycling factor [Bacilli bacterium]MDY3047579.1 ribosome recycling factor [Candidatus Enterosoma sp.]